MAERWKKIKGSRDYWISSYGRLKHGSRFLLTPSKSPGYTRKTIWYLDGSKKRWSLNVLVAENFIRTKPAGSQVNHKDLNKKNDKVRNLEYLTPKENVQHAIENGVVWGKKPEGWDSPKGERNGRAVLTQKLVRRIRFLYN